MNIKDIIKGNTVRFDSYRSGFFYYHIEYENETYQFTVPQDDIGTATLNAEDKAMLFMRWIRKAIDSNEFIKIK